MPQALFSPSVYVNIRMKSWIISLDVILFLVFPELSSKLKSNCTDFKSLLTCESILALHLITLRWPAVISKIQLLFPFHTSKNFLPCQLQSFSIDKSIHIIFGYPFHKLHLIKSTSSIQKTMNLENKCFPSYLYVKEGRVGGREEGAAK